MGNFSFDNIRQTNNSSNNNRVSYFSLKNDGDSAIVRFMHDTIESFDVVNCHDVTVNNQRRRVGCVREKDKPADYCPLCASGNPFKQRMYVHLVEYVKDDNGNITPVAKVWDRPVSYAYKLRDYLNNYGNLSDVIFTVKRNGAAGDLSTTYTEMPGMPNMYPAEKYPKIEFPSDYQALGIAVMKKSVDEIRAYLETGSFPATNNNQKPAQQNVENRNFNSYSAPVSNATPQTATPVTTEGSFGATTVPTQQPNNIATQTYPWQQTPKSETPNTPNRPVRYY